MIELCQIKGDWSMEVLKNSIDIKIEIEKVFCNVCGEEIKKDIYGYYNDYIHIEKKWGYNSDFDGEKHSFDICSQCYKKMVSDFKIPVNGE